MSNIPDNKYAKLFGDNWGVLVFVALLFAGAITIISSIITHRNDVRAVSKQNAGCIYLESSDLGDGQHYMICDGQIVLKRLADEDAVESTPEEKLEEVVPTAPVK
jgi:hypothetical protein